MSYLESLAREIRREAGTNAGGADEDLFLVYAVLLLAKGRHVTAEDVHNAWVAWKEMHGATHESMVPFADLDAQTQAEDSPFVAAIRRVASGLNLGPLQE